MNVNAPQVALNWIVSEADPNHVNRPNKQACITEVRGKEVNSQKVN